MKGKKSLILASIFAGIGLVGATFATWAVTDNADPFGLKISPGTIQADNTDFVTLSYGSRVYGNVENLAVGTNRLAATIPLKVETSTEEAYEGTFSVSILNQTTKDEHEPLLFDYLTVRIYDEAIAAEAGVVSDATLEGKTPLITCNKTNSTGSEEIEVGHGNDGIVTVYAVVTLAGSDQVNASTLEKIKSDVVYLQFDWNKNVNDDDDVTTSTVYFNYGSGNQNKEVYCYAWTATKTNDDFPGKLMTDEGNGLYSYELSADYSDLLFVDYTKSTKTENYKTADLTIDSQGRTQTPCYTKTNEGGSWGVKPTVVEEGWYLVGTINNWTPSASFKLSADSEHTGEYKIDGIQLAVGNALKVRDASGANWKTSTDPWTGCYFENDSDGNIVITEAGVYSIHYNGNEEGVNKVYLTK